MPSKYFQGIVETLKSIPPSQLNNLHYVPRNVWFFGWLLQKQRGTVERSQLYDLIGDQFRDRIDTTVDEAPDSEVIRQSNSDEDGEGFLTIKDNLLSAIEDHFNGEYEVNRILPDFAQMHGKRFIRRLNYLAPQPRGGLILPVSAFFNAHLEATFEPVDNYVVGTQLSSEEQAVVDTLRVVSPPKRMKSAWKFLLCVYPHKGALSQPDVEHLCNMLRWFSQEAGHIPVLLFASSVNALHATDILGHDEQIHYMWAFSALRLLQKIPVVVEQHGDAAITAFPAIFTPQKQQTLSAKVAIDNWTAAIDNHNSSAASSSPEKKK